MKLVLKAACTLALLSGAAHAHDVWVIAPAQQPADRVLEADLGYSHVYPLPEAIAADRVQIFKPMEIIDSQNRATAMVLRGGENYQYATRNPLKAGTYRVTATYQPTFWVKNAQGKWSQNNMTQVPDATYCEQSQMYGKSIVQVGDRFDLAAASRPVGQELEIVPMANPNTVAAGKLLPLQVLYQGKPLAGATVVATADTVINQDTDAMMDHREINGYSAKTDAQGRVNFLPLVEGQWKVKVVHKAPFADQKVCQHVSLYSTLIVPVGTKRAPLDESHAHHHHNH